MNGLTTRGDHPFDQVILPRRRESQPGAHGFEAPHDGVSGVMGDEAGVPGGGAFEHNDVSGFGVAESVGDFLYDDSVADAAGTAVQCGFHGGAGNQVESPDEGLEQRHEDDGNEYYHGDFDIPGGGFFLWFFRGFVPGFFAVSR